MTRAIVCSHDTVKRDGVIFETRPIGPRFWPLKKNGEPYERIPERLHLAMDELCAMPDDEFNLIRYGCKQ